VAADAKPGKGVTVDDLLAYPRAVLLEHFLLRSGLRPGNLVNAGYGLAAPPGLTIGDIQYLMFQGPARRTMRAVGPLSPADEKAVESLRDGLGLRTFTNHELHTQYGALTTYAWHLGEHPQGTHFAPIYHALAQLGVARPELKKHWPTIRRRLAYTQILAEEVCFLDESFRPGILQELPGWIANKAESLVATAVECINLLLEVRAEERIRFEDLVDRLKEIHALFTSINTTLDGFLLVSARHHARHRSDELFRVDADRVVFDGEFADGALRFGMMQTYLQTELLKSSVARTVQRDGEAWLVLTGDRFPGIEFAFRRSKAGTPDQGTLRIRYTLSLAEFTKAVLDFLFFAVKEILRDMTPPADVPKPGQDSG
jgi:hypothetical protein